MVNFGFDHYHSPHTSSSFRRLGRSLSGLGRSRVMWFEKPPLMFLSTWHVLPTSSLLLVLLNKTSPALNEIVSVFGKFLLQNELGSFPDELTVGRDIHWAQMCDALAINLGFPTSKARFHYMALNKELLALLSLL
jgi:hypothetical protein